MLALIDILVAINVVMSCILNTVETWSGLVYRLDLRLHWDKFFSMDYRQPHQRIELHNSVWKLAFITDTRELRSKALTTGLQRISQPLMCGN